MAKLVFGCGYLGRRVVQKWLDGGHQVFAVTRSQDRADQWATCGIQPIVGDLTESITIPPIPSLETVVFAVGFDRRAGKSIHDVYVGGLKAALGALPIVPARFIYISSTGVYGQMDGTWVDEQSECEPTRAGGRACLDAEKLLADHAIGKRSIILRLAGIYGPGRVPRLNALRAGEPLSAARDSHVNLIYVEDAVEAVIAAERCVTPPDRFVVSDGNPVLRGDFYSELARLADLPPPKFDEPSTASSTEKRSLGDKRIRNQRMRSELIPVLGYPSYREGLAQIVAEDAMN